jgi:hypothetical protein
MNPTVCVGNLVYACEQSGRLGARIKSCGAVACVDGACTDPCSKAESNRSYIGCTYWPTVTTNSQVPKDFSFAVAVANAQSEEVTVTVSSAVNPSVASAKIPPGSLATLTLPWVDGLKQQYPGETSVWQPSGSYRLSATLPVTVYQFNALEYVLPHNCTLGADENPFDGKCYSWSNDASLLLPEHALDKEYMVIARPTAAMKSGGQTKTSPGFFSVTAVKEGVTHLTVKLTADTQGGAGSVPAYTKGQTATFDLPKWGVLQIVSKTPADCTPAKGEFCDLSADTDLTGTLVSSDKEVVVFSGHNCAFVPFSTWACDHLEEQLFPTRALGRRYLAAQTISSGKDPCLYRVVSVEKGNQIAFDPPIHDPVVLDEGKFVEFPSTESFQVRGSGRFALAQFMVGQQYSNSTPLQGAPGDPSMALAAPVEQYRKSYRFLAPETYEQSYVNLFAPGPAVVTLDGKAIEESTFAVVGGTGYKVARVKIAAGAHLAESTDRFGISVYGVGSYTSYMYPGGLDLGVLE